MRKTPFYIKALFFSGLFILWAVFSVKAQKISLKKNQICVENSIFLLQKSISKYEFDLYLPDQRFLCKVKVLSKYFEGGSKISDCLLLFDNTAKAQVSVPNSSIKLGVVRLLLNHNYDSLSISKELFMNSFAKKYPIVIQSKNLMTNNQNIDYDIFKRSKKASIIIQNDSIIQGNVFIGRISTLPAFQFENAEVYKIHLPNKTVIAEGKVNGLKLVLITKKDHFIHNLSINSTQNTLNQIIYFLIDEGYL